MNRLKKEEIRKRNEARKGLSLADIAALDHKEEIEKQIKLLADDIHIEKFPEEYDFMYDSSVDAGDRKKGINPMSKDYVDEINSKRLALGATALSESGMPTSNDTMAICVEEAKKTTLKGLDSLN